MPLYIVSHKDPIPRQQRDDLAAAITRIHTTLFTTPSLFVNVKFEDASSGSYYVAGKPTRVNAIHAHVRPGSSRPRSAYNKLCAQLRAAWNETFAPWASTSSYFSSEPTSPTWPASPTSPTATINSTATTIAAANTSSFRDSNGSAYSFAPLSPTAGTGVAPAVSAPAPPRIPLDTIFVYGSIIAGEEKGFTLPEAGRDGEWVRENLTAFERRAEEDGDEDMRMLVDEIRQRGLGGVVAVENDGMWSEKGRKVLGL